MSIEFIKDELYRYDGNIDLCEKYAEDDFIKDLYDNYKGCDIYICDSITAKFGCPLRECNYSAKYYNGYVYVLNYDKSFGKYYHKISADLFDKVYK